jgi:hypothetical protein
MNSTSTVHLGTKKAHDWVVEQLADLFRTTHTVKTQHVTKSRGRHCGDIELVTYLVNTVGPVSLVLDKIRKYRDDNNNNPPSADSFMSAISSTSGRLHSEFIRLLFLQAHRETDRFFAPSGVQFAQEGRGLFHFRRVAFTVNLKAKVGNTLGKAADLRVIINIDGTPITSRTHTHPSHSQTSRLLTSSLSSGVPVPRATQCMGGV